MNIRTFQFFSWLVAGAFIINLFSCKPAAHQEDATRADADTTTLSTTPDRVTQLRSHLENANDSMVLVIVHRGDWKHAPENSLKAIENCIAMGADMVEVDLKKTKDNQLVLMHDDRLDRTTNGKGLVADWTLDSLRTLQLKDAHGDLSAYTIPTLAEAMQTAKDKILINLDKGYDYFDLAYDILKETETLDQVIIKGGVTVAQLKQDYGARLEEIYYMPVIRLNDAAAETMIEDFQEHYGPVAFEFVFNTMDSPVLDRFNELRQAGSRVWVNSLWASLNAGHDDNKAVADPNGIYGWYIDRGVNMIQTDQPVLLIDYLQGRGLHE